MRVCHMRRSMHGESARSSACITLLLSLSDMSARIIVAGPGLVASKCETHFFALICKVTKDMIL